MTITYRVDLESNTGETLAVINNFLSLSFTQRIDRKGNYTLQLSGYDDTRLLFQDDSIIRVWMKDPAENIPWTNVFNGIHKTFTDALRENGMLAFTSFGPDSMELLDKAEILYSDGTSQAEKEGAASTVMYEYVLENAGASATTANGRQDNHTNPITNAPDLAEGPTWKGSEEWEQLLITLQRIREYSINQNDQVDFRVDYLGSYTWQFLAGKLGTDRTVEGLTTTSNGLNGAGNVPVVFGPAYGNVLTFTKTESRYNEANSVTVIGQGSGTGRDAVTETDTIQATRSAIAKREKVINANNITQGDTTALTDRALAGLDKYKGRESFNFKPKRGAQILFRDYFFGDFVTGEDRDGNRRNRQIVELTVNVNPTTNALIERQQIKFSDI